MRQGSDEWLAERRLGVTSTDIPALLGISPYRSEGDVARDKQGVEEEYDADTLRRFRLGHALEDIVAAEEKIEHGIRLIHAGFYIHPDDPILRTSLDFIRIGERTIVEVKTSASRDWENGLPEYVEAQVRWQMGVARFPKAHVAALRYGQTLVCHDVEHDADVFAGLVTIAHDFWRRLQDGGPFDETRASVRRAWPFDIDLMMAADEELHEAVASLLATRRDLGLLRDLEDKLVTAIQMRMGPASVLLGDSWRVTWRRSKDSEVIDYKSLANDALGLLQPETIDALMTRHTSTREGTRRFILKEATE
jgi:putative phage-type endonuclease